MDEELLRQKGIEPVNPRRAFLQDMELVIGKRAALAPRAGRTVHGMLFSLTHAELDALYSEPSVRDYRPEPVSAHLPDGGMTPALCFNLPVPPGILEQDPGYVSKLKALAARIGLPPEFVSSIGR